MKSVLITGVNGFLGGYLARCFSEGGWRVMGLDRSPPRTALLPHIIRFLKFELPDPRLPTQLRELLPTLFIHCASRASVAGSWSQVEIDFASGPPLVFELLDAIRRDSPRTMFLLFSSAAVYGNPERLPISEEARLAPISPYGFHKMQCEQLCVEFASCFGLRTAGLRIFSAYGPGLRRQVVWDVCQKLSEPGQAMFQGTGLESRDFVHARDVARAARHIVEVAPLQGEMYNVATGQETSIAQLVAQVEALLPGTGNYRFDGKLPHGVPIQWRADISRLEGIGFRPRITVEEGIRETVAWYREEVMQKCRRSSA